MINSIDEVPAALSRYVPNTSRFREHYTLDRIQHFLASIGKPQDSYRSAHIAGTSGKTSTAYFLRGYLQGAHQRTGLTVSPHIVSITERAQVDGGPLRDDLFVGYLRRFLSLAEASGIPLTYFEIVVAFAYWVFAEQRIDYAVIETGLGGMLDGTNTISRPDKLCLITDIGFDHTEILGNTIEAIAEQKAGIIQPGNHALMIEQSRQAQEVIAQRANKVGATVEIVPAAKVTPPGLPSFQRRNWSLAQAGFGYLAHRDKLAYSASDLLQAAPGMQPPGRLERCSIRGRTVTLDGAHNAQKLAALRQALGEQGITQGVAVLANLVKAPDEKLDAALTELRPLAAHLIVPDFSVVQDLNKDSIPAQVTASRARQLGYPSVEVAADLESALRALVNRSEKELLVTGSLYLVSQIRGLIGGCAKTAAPEL